MSFTNKVVIVTGASAGIGIAIAKLFAKENAKLVITGRDFERLRKTALECEEISCEKPLEIVADLEKLDEVKKIIPKTVERYGKIDVLVNNAAMFVFMTIETDNFLESFDKHMAVNVRAPLTLMKDATPYLIESKGNIVNISSIAGISAVSTGAAYCGSKAALNHVGRCVALDLASKGVRVNTISLGPVRTISNKDRIELLRKHFAATVPLGKPAEDVDVAELIAYLASDKARSVTGSLYSLDCGTGVTGLASYSNMGNVVKAQIKLTN